MKRFALFLITLVLAAAAHAATSVAFVRGQAAQTTYIGWNHPTQASADAFALKGCRAAAKRVGAAAAKCVVGGRYTTLGAGAVVCGKSECTWATGRASKQEAADAAYRGCVDAGHGNCNATNIDTWIEEVGEAAPARPRAAPAKQCSPPAGKTTRSTTRCNNGACSRTFENGCTVQFQAPYCHNPFNGQWEWKPDGC
ncbi:MAG: hypothetical protein V4693_06385 [Pseudomonadota bacterium]